METPTPETQDRSVPWRAISGWTLVVLTAIAVAAMVVGLWVHRTILETDAFMAAVTPAVESEAVQTLVADRVSDRLLEALELETRIADALGQVEERIVTGLAEALDIDEAAVRVLVERGLGLDELASTLSSGVEARIRGVIGDLVASPEGDELLLGLIETTHEKTVLLLRDEFDQLPNLVVESGEVRLNLVPIMANVLRELVNSGIDIIGLDREIPPFDSSEDAEAAIARLAEVLGRDLPDDFGQVRIMSEERLDAAQDLLVLFDRATWLLVGVAVLIAILAVLLAPAVPSGLIRVGVATVVGAAIGWIGVNLILSGLAEGAADALGRAAISDIAQAFVMTMQRTAIGLGIIGVVVAVLGFLLGRRTTSGEAATG